MALGNDGFSDCRILCDPEYHTEWSCKTYCPGYIYKPILSTSSSVSGTTVLYAGKTNPYTNSIIASSLAVFLVLACVVIYFVRRQRKKKNNCCELFWKGSQIKHPVQETNPAHINSDANQIVQYENELNHIKEQSVTLLQRNENNESRLNGTANNDFTRNTDTGVTDGLNEHISVTEPLLRQHGQTNNNVTASHENEPELSDTSLRPLIGNTNDSELNESSSGGGTTEVIELDTSNVINQSSVNVTRDTVGMVCTVYESSVDLSDGLSVSDDCSLRLLENITVSGNSFDDVTETYV